MGEGPMTTRSLTAKPDTERETFGPTFDQQNMPFNHSRTSRHQNTSQNDVSNNVSRQNISRHNTSRQKKE